MSPQVCEFTCLPSSNSAYAVVKGIPGGVPSLLVHFLGRTAIMTAGMYVAGFRGAKALKGGAGAAAAMEVSLLIWALTEVHKEKVEAPP